VNFLSPKTPWIAKKAFPSFIWDITTDEKSIYLTFDDGPTPVVTENVLQLLKAYDAKATFFCIGKNIVENPSIYRQILTDGHAVGNHTFSHEKGWKTTKENYLASVLQSQKTMQTVNTSSTSQLLFRPPYGRIKPSQAKALQQLGYAIVMWDVLTQDWDASISKKKVLQNATQTAKEGSIIVLHDSIKASKHMLYALPKMLDYFSKKGFSFKKIELKSGF